MKIAVAGTNNTVAAHFAHCDTFHVFKTEKGEITSSENIPNPGHEPGFLPNFLHEKGVDVIVSGGMGSRAVDIFNSHGIEAVIGASGDCSSAAENYLKGELESKGAFCHEHDD